MFFNDAVQGDITQGESAARYNALNAMLRGEEDLPDSDTGGSVDRHTVLFVNTSQQTVPAFTAVSVTGSFVENSNRECEFSRQAGDCIVAGIPAVDDTFFWGISVCETLPGEYGELVISGLAAALFSGEGSFVTPSENGLIAGDQGRAAVMLRPENSGSSWSIPGMVVLGGASGSAGGTVEEYAGHFKLRALSLDSLEIYSGVFPADDFCGFTDVPGLQYIPRTVMTGLAGAERRIYLQFFYDREKKLYSAGFAVTLDPQAVFYRLIGTFSGGKVVQIYQDLSEMSFANDWYLK